MPINLARPRHAGRGPSWLAVKAAAR